MANQDVVLNIVAKADTSTVQGEFGQMAQQLSRVFDQALEGIGNKLAEVIIRGAQAGMRSALVDPSGRPIQQAPMGVPAVVAPTPGAIPPGPPPPPPMQQMQGGFLDPFANQQGAIRGGMLPTGMTENVGFGQSTRLEALFQQARMMQAMQRAGVDPGMTAEQQAQFGQGAEEARGNLRNLQTEMSELNAQLRKATENLSKLDESMREAPEDMKEGIATAIQEEKRNIGQLGGQVGALGQAAGTAAQQAGLFGQMGQQQGFNWGQAGMVMGGVATIGQSLIQIPAALRGAQAARAETENLEARAMMRGDIERLIATQQLGGQERLAGAAGREEGGRIGLQALAGVAALMAAPMTGGLSLPFAIGGMGLLGKSAVDIAGFESGRQQNIEQRIQAQMGTQAEFFEMTRRGRGTAVGAFRGAQAMGAPEMAGFLTGQLGMPANLRQFAMEQGMSPEMFQQFLSQTAQMGGAFLGQTPTLMQQGAMGPLQGLMRAQAQGLAQAPEIAGGLFQAGAFGGVGQQQQQAMQMTREMFENAVAAGLDKASTGRALLGMSQRAEQIGFGGQAQARIETEQAMGLAQRVFGAQVTGAQFNAMQNMQQNLMGAGQAEGGLAAVGGMMGVREFAKTRGMRLTGIQEEQMRQMGTDPEFMRQMIAKQRGVPESEISMDEATEAAGQLRGQILGGVAQAGERAFGKEGGFEAVRRFAGVRTGQGMTALRNMLDSVQRGQTGMTPVNMNEEQFRQWMQTGGSAFEPGRAGVQEQLDRAQAGAPGGQIARAMAGAEMQQISGGLNSLGNILPQVNFALNKLIDRANEVLAGQGQAQRRGGYVDFGQRRGGISNMSPEIANQYLTDMLSGKTSSGGAGGGFQRGGPASQGTR